ncbi:hypothetical protein MPTK1_5g06560 [Marchantia polymorpha subsp. ruderalis]|uniref:Uncharacterized protein n=2 Tax=Marchantia polymorpha TaxID=3197 RepID=A0AAF6BFM0_MARPO|nr:hypothetical protein MARPO_0171s0027 [Marchantia polymorpha]BBN10804.1 hypothetical protein Mp_5g06560 [Marchantia polymorpha subsp. ruderalis]|eukprot:PTQ28188.1 hypothetical protein MARPO_0171s0027 [Marchantia polymorpha]
MDGWRDERLQVVVEVLEKNGGWLGGSTSTCLGLPRPPVLSTTTNFKKDRLASLENPPSDSEPTKPSDRRATFESTRFSSAPTCTRISNLARSRAPTDADFSRRGRKGGPGILKVLKPRFKFSHFLYLRTLNRSLALSLAPISRKCTVALRRSNRNEAGALENSTRLEHGGLPTGKGAMKVKFLKSGTHGASRDESSRGEKK